MRPTLHLCLALAFAGALGAAPTPVLVELFTSEGCSSCPPADRILDALDRTQPVPGVEVIVLSEHVDYWDGIGWKDPFSQALFTQRQQQYGRRFNLEGVYTPQMVVDGRTQFVGNDGRKAVNAIDAAGKKTHAEIALTLLPDGRLEIRSAPIAATLVVAMADERARTEVKRGENGGKTLEHVSVARRLTTQKFNKEGREVVEIPAGTGAARRVIVFLQESSGAVIGSAQLKLP